MRLYDAIVKDTENSIFKIEDFNEVLKNETIEQATKEKILYLMVKISKINAFPFSLSASESIRYFFTDEDLISREGYSDILDKMYTFCIKKEIDVSAIETICKIAKANNACYAHDVKQNKEFMQLINSVLTFTHDYGINNNYLLSDLFTNKDLIYGNFENRKELIFEWATRNELENCDEDTRSVIWKLLTSYSIETNDKDADKMLIDLCFEKNCFMPHIMEALIEDCKSLTSIDIHYLHKIFPMFMENFKKGNYFINMSDLQTSGVSYLVEEIKELSRECALFDIVRKKSLIDEATKKEVYDSILSSSHKEATAKIMGSNLDLDEKKYILSIVENSSFPLTSIKEENIVSLIDIAISSILITSDENKDFFYNIVTLAKAYLLTNHGDKLDYLKQILSIEEYKKDTSKLNRALFYINNNIQQIDSFDCDFASNKMAFYYTDEQFKEATDLLKKVNEQRTTKAIFFKLLTNGCVRDNKKREEYLTFAAVSDPFLINLEEIEREAEIFNKEEQIYKNVLDSTKEFLKNTNYSSSIFEKNKCKVKNTTNN